MDHPSIHYEYWLRSDYWSSGIVRRKLTRLNGGGHQPLEWGQLAFSIRLDLYRSSPESGDMQCKPGVSKPTICSHSEGWWGTVLRGGYGLLEP